MMIAKAEAIASNHAANLKAASREQIELARIFQRAAFDDGINDGDLTRAEMATCPGTFIPAPIYMDLALKFSEQSWREALFAHLAVMK